MKSPLVSALLLACAVALIISGAIIAHGGDTLTSAVVSAVTN